MAAGWEGEGKRTFYGRIVLVDEVALDKLDGQTRLADATTAYHNELVLPQKLSHIFRTCPTLEHLLGESVPLKPSLLHLLIEARLIDLLIPRGIGMEVRGWK